MFFIECYSWLYTEYLLQGLIRKHMCCSPSFCCVLIALELQHFHLCTLPDLFAFEYVPMCLNMGRCCVCVCVCVRALAHAHLSMCVCVRLCCTARF